MSEAYKAPQENEGLAEAKAVLRRNVYEFFGDIDNEDLEKVLNPQEVDMEKQASAVAPEDSLDGMLLASKREREYSALDAYGVVLEHEQTAREKARYDTPYGTDVEANAPRITEEQAADLKAQTLTEFVEERRSLQKLAEEMAMTADDQEAQARVGKELDDAIDQFSEKYGLDVQAKADLNDKVDTWIAGTLSKFEPDSGPKEPDAEKEQPEQSELDALRAAVTELKERADKADARNAFLREGLLGIVGAEDPRAAAEEIAKTYKETFSDEDQPQPATPEDEPTQPIPVVEESERENDEPELKGIRKYIAKFRVLNYLNRENSGKSEVTAKIAEITNGVQAYAKKRRNNTKDVQAPTLYEQQEKKFTKKRVLVIAGVGAAAVALTAAAIAFGPDVTDHISSIDLPSWLGGDETTHAHKVVTEPTMDQMTVDIGGDSGDTSGLTGAEGTSGTEVTDFSNEAATVTSGEGWIHTLNEMGIPQSEQGDILQKLLESNDPDIQEWVYDRGGEPGITKTGQIPAEVLDKISRL